jgi:hypothetical protein
LHDNIQQLADGDIDDDIFKDHNDLFVLVACLHGCIHEIRHNHYLKRQRGSKGSINVLEEDQIHGSVMTSSSVNTK